MRPFAFALCTILTLAACSSTRPPLKPLPATGGTDQLWGALQQARGDFDGFESLVEVRATGNGRSQNFRAKVTADRQRKVQITGIGPLGVDLFTLFMTGEQLLFLNHLNSTYWEGTADRFVSSLGPLGAMTSEDLALLLVGLPPESGRCDSSGICRGDRLSYRLGATGLQAVSGKALEVEFQPAAFPAQRLRIASPGAGTLDIRHLELYGAPKVLRTPQVPSTYRCCELPDGTQQ